MKNEIVNYLEDIDIVNINDWVYNYSAWNTALQIRNTMSTDLIFRFDKSTNKLYINCAFDVPENITIEYVPQYQDVSEIKSDYWIDILIRLSIALTKVTIEAEPLGFDTPEVEGTEL